LFRREIQKLARKLLQLLHATGKNVGERSYDAEKNMSNQTIQISARAVISAGKANLGKKFPSVLQYRCGRGKGRVSLLLPKLQTETRNNSQEHKHRVT